MNTKFKYFLIRLKMKWLEFVFDNFKRAEFFNPENKNWYPAYISFMRVTFGINEKEAYFIAKNIVMRNPTNLNNIYLVLKYFCNTVFSATNKLFITEIKRDVLTFIKKDILKAIYFVNREHIITQVDKISAAFRIKKFSEAGYNKTGTCNTCKSFDILYVDESDNPKHFLKCNYWTKTLKSQYRKGCEKYNSIFK